MTAQPRQLLLARSPAELVWGTVPHCPLGGSQCKGTVRRVGDIGQPLLLTAIQFPATSIMKANQTSPGK